MLSAAPRDPAMMRYLDNAVSDRASVNENYGRELLELHTVGIDGGYNEKDVRNCAYMMTGRTVDQRGQVQLRPGRHWIGAVKVLGFNTTRTPAGRASPSATQYLRYLATHPSTAQYIARKLAVRFVCDNPPQRAGATGSPGRTSTTARRSSPVLQVLFRSLEFWIATGLKTRRPLENFVATARVARRRARHRHPAGAREPVLA